jgi:alpha-galactosidase
MFAAMLLGVFLPSPGFGQDSVVHLEDLDLSVIRQGSGKAQKNLSAGGGPLSIAGTKYEHGFGTQAESYFKLRLDGRAKSFHAMVGIDDSAPNFWGTSLQFWIEGDGKILAKTGRIRRRQPAQKIEADLTGVKEATLVVAATGFGIRGDQGDWVDAEFTMASGAPIPTALDPEPELILTPPLPAKPRFTGPTVFGVRPGRPVLFSVTATGRAPILFEASGLPEGLKLNSATGEISGALDQPGEHLIHLRVRNSRGEARRDLTIVVGEGIALTPPMGWNSWNSWGWNVTQDQVLASAKMMAAKLREHGWAYVNIDDTWQGKRGGSENAIVPNRKFPDMSGLVKQIHNLGLKAGIYSTPWMTSYAGHIGGSADSADGTYPWMASADENQQTSQASRYQRFGKYSFTDRDVKEFADWGFDYLKYDWNPIDIPHTKVAFDLMRAGTRDMVFSLSNGAPFERGDGLAAYSQLWRTSGDMSDTWGAIRANAFELARWARFQGPGHWNDEDMLVIGRVSLGDEMHESRLTPNEQYLHISQWCLLGSPLLIGCDLEHISPFTMNLLTNDEVLDVDQDPLGKMAQPVRQSDAEQVWFKPLEDGSLAVGLFNVSEEPRRVSVSWKELGLSGSHIVRDLWRQKDLGRHRDAFSAMVPRHGVILVRVRA